MLDDDSRLEILAAIGVDVYRLRAVTGIGTNEPAAAKQGTAGRHENAAPRLAIACDNGVRLDPRCVRLFAQIARALDVADSSIAWIDITADRELTALPDVPAWLMIGAAAARNCSAHLSLAQQGAVTIAVAAEPSDLGRGAAARRALWQALKPIARRLRSGG